MDLRTSFFAALLWLPVANAAESRPLEGDYYLYGAMEMAARLVLKKDGSFATAAAYGSANGAAKRRFSPSKKTGSDNPPSSK